MPLIRARAGEAAALPADRASLIAALEGGSAGERLHAARALAALPGAVAPLSAALHVEAEPAVREVIFTALARLGCEEAADALLPLLRARQASLRNGALAALAAMPGRLPARLPALLADPDADIRLLACELARALPAPEATTLLCAVVERESEPNVCAAALDVLTELGGPQALPVLERGARRFDATPFLRFAFEVAIRRIRASADTDP
ncbi:HEAT repeat domain-containing protein [Ancylobacter vacuolatus]|uniref:HEAT repeat protein n=1 Tax=Ancylobacter vacuolatus TaxID=223389 RepID=A0ABU0DL10_9HYPH|nr:HEAT repeat domain-containing protein [Ancylobacter vacuolatus]MDQ0349094.1 HEAT repeat protein [Ancylobacter vacuolatus]